MENPTTLFNNIVAKCIVEIIPKVSHIVSEEFHQAIYNNNDRKTYIEKIKARIEDMIKSTNLREKYPNLWTDITNTCIGIIMYLVKQNTKDEVIRACIEHVIPEVKNILDTQFNKIINGTIKTSLDIGRIYHDESMLLIRYVVKLEIDKLLSRLRYPEDIYMCVNAGCIDKIMLMIKDILEDKKTKISNSLAISGAEHDTHPYIVPLYANRNASTYDWKISEKYKEYRYHEMKQNHENSLAELLYDEDFNERDAFVQFFKNVKTGEYVVCMQVEYYRGVVRDVLAITNFGSVYHRYHLYIVDKFTGDYEIPKILMDALIDGLIQNIKNPVKSSGDVFDRFISAVKTSQTVASVRQSDGKKKIQPRTI